MAEQWQFIDTGAGDAAWNMAYDEATLREAESSGMPFLRFYGWKEPAVTFGYFQRYAEVESLTTLRPLIRRQTGGGIVPHDADWTYSLSIPIRHDWYEMKAVESYRRAHDWLRRAFDRLGISTELADCCDSSGPGRCFVGAEKFDLLLGDRKLAGAAQRRMKSGLLIQGSLQPGEIAVKRADWQKTMLETIDADWGEYRADARFESRVEEAVRLKYGSEAFNQRR